MLRKRLTYLTLAVATATVIAGALGITGARADDDNERFTATDPVWKEECGSCHVAYPPRLLPASSWKQIMSGLDKHFGSDASVDKTTADHIAAFLDRNAGRERNSGTSPNLRITRTRWFLHEHDEVSASTWLNPKVKSASNCEACHVDAANGDFNEHRVRIPR